MKDELTCYQEFLKKVTFIDPDTGRIDVEFTCGRGNKGIKRMTNIGSLNHDGYIRIWCNNRLSFKHRFLFWYYHGYLPKEIDHIDRNKQNNSIKNLRAVDRKANCLNKSARKPYTKLSVANVHALCKDLLSGMSITDVAKKYHRSRTQIKQIKLKHYWKDIASLYF